LPPVKDPGRIENGTRDSIIAAFVAAVICVFVLQLWKADLSVPMSYAGDSLALGATIKGLTENLWVLSNPALGAPYGQQFADYPISEYLHLVNLKLLGTIAPTYAWAMNVYFLISFPLTAGLATWVLRRFGISTQSSLVTAILFSFLPIRFYRGIHHLFYSAYFTIPIVMYLALRLASGKTAVKHRTENQGRPFWKRRHVWVLATLIIVLGGTGVYGVFFTLIFLAVGSCYGAARHKTSAPLRDGGIIAAGLIACTLVATLPAVLYSYEHGSNATAVDRNPQEAEMYGLRISHLMMPIIEHRLESFASFRRRYDSEGTAFPVNENGTVSLGVIGAAGFVVLLLCTITGTSRFAHPEMASALTVLNVWAVLVATLGGLSAWIAMLVTAKIRGYNRISPFIGFLALTAVAIVFDTLMRRGGIYRRITFVAMPLLLAAGVLDQTSAAFVPNYEILKRTFAEDRQFVATLEQQLPNRAMVFQLPYVPWPEHPSVRTLGEYQLLRGYLHSRTLRWSFAAMKGRPGDAWIQHVSSRPVAEMADMLAVAGFSGIYVDLRGYADTNIDTALTHVVGQQPIRSMDGDRLFFSLVEYTRNLRTAYSPADWDRMHAEVLYPTVATWTDGCSRLESDGSGSQWRWCDSSPILALDNADMKRRNVRVSMKVGSGSAQPSDLRIEAPGVAQTVPLSSDVPAVVSFDVSLSPGTTKVRLRSDSMRVITPGDKRKLFIRITDFKVADVIPPASMALESGCSDPEAKGFSQWRWCSNAATLRLQNDSTTTKQVAVCLAFHTATSEPAAFDVSGPGMPGIVQARPGVSSVRRVITVAPGVTRIQVRTNAKPLNVPGDPRTLVFSLDHSTAIDLSSAATIYAN
jgi:hypothetical protein